MNLAELSGLVNIPMQVGQVSKWAADVKIMKKTRRIGYFRGFDVAGVARKQAEIDCGFTQFDLRIQC